MTDSILDQRLRTFGLKLRGQLDDIRMKLLPAGGAAGNVLTKTSSVDYAAAWAAPTGGGGGAVSSFNTRVGDIVLTLGDVTTALGYTPTSITGLTGIQSVAALKTGLSLVKADVGLGSVDNTPDANKPVSTAQAAADATKQPLDATLTAFAAVNWSAGVQLIALTAADTFALKTVGAAAGNILDKAAGDSLYQPTGSYLTANQTITLSGDVSGSGATAIAVTIGANKVTRGMLAATAGATILGATAAGNVTDLTAAQAKTFLAIASTDVSGLGYFATGTDAANLTGTVAAARIAANSLAPSKLTDAAAASIFGATAAGARADLTAAQVRSFLGEWTEVIKTADETRSSNATIAADTDLIVALGAGTYLIKIEAIINIANATMDYQFAYLWNGGDGGANATLNWARRYANAGGGSALNSIGVSSAWNTAIVVATTFFGLGSIEVLACVTVTNAGTFQFGWSQNTSDAGNISVVKGSALRWLKIA